MFFQGAPGSVGAFFEVIRERLCKACNVVGPDGSAVNRGELITAQAGATPISINFDQMGALEAGEISYDGTGGNLIGTELVFDSIFSDDRPGYSPLHRQDCTLNFQTGGYTGGSGNIFTFDGGGELTLTGNIVDQGDASDDSDDMELFSGTILSGSCNSVSLSASLGFLNVNGVGMDGKAPAGLLGVPLLRRRR